MRSQPPRIEGNPVRSPINRQAALIMKRASWIHQPPIETTVTLEKYEAMKNKYNETYAKLLANQMELTSVRKQLKSAVNRVNETEKELVLRLKQLANKLRAQTPVNEPDLKRVEALSKLHSI